MPPEPFPEPSEDLSGGTESETLPQPTRQTGPQPVDGVAARWYALRSIFAPPDIVTTPSLEDRPPMVAVFSLAGGVGKTCLVATLGRALAAFGERVLLADTAAYGRCRFISVRATLSPGWSEPFLLPEGRTTRRYKS